jgi:hypothetical protein
MSLQAMTTRWQKVKTLQQRGKYLAIVIFPNALHRSLCACIFLTVRNIRYVLFTNIARHINPSALNTNVNQIHIGDTVAPCVYTDDRNFCYVLFHENVRVHGPKSCLKMLPTLI